MRFARGLSGGTGQSFDWSKIPTDLDKRLIVAGGLTAENVGVAIRQCSPYAVDVSGGVECAPGVKDARKINQLMSEVRHAKSAVTR